MPARAGGAPKLREGSTPDQGAGGGATKALPPPGHPFLRQGATPPSVVPPVAGRPAMAPKVMQV